MEKIIDKTIETTIETTIEPRKKFYQNKLTTNITFISIVILGLIGIILLYMAIVMGKINLYGNSINLAKSNFYYQSTSQFSSNISSILINNDIDEINKLFVDSNLVGIKCRIEHCDNNNILYDNSTIHYGDISSDVSFFVGISRQELYDDNNDFIGYNFYSFDFYILENAIYDDVYKWGDSFVEFLYKNQNNIWTIGILVGTFIIYLYILLILSCGHCKNSNTITPLKISKFPFEINLCVFLVLIFVSCGLILYLFYQALDNFYYNGLILCLVYIGIAEILYLFLTLDFCLRLKNKTFLKTTLIYKVYLYISNAIKKFNLSQNINVLWKYVIVYIVANCFIFLGGLLFGLLGFLSNFCIVNAIVFIAMMYIAMNINKLNKACEAIAAGNYNNIYDDKNDNDDTKNVFLGVSSISKKLMYFGFDSIADNLENISTGMEEAIQERLKSERLKTELITNVSHDIKTPLTSIINYSDLISKEDCSNDKINEYAQVLQRQSNKLKRLLEDVIQASKASSGNLNVEFEDIELNVFIEQIIAEYTDKLEENSLTLITEIPNEKEIIISTDAKMLSRVFDNLFENVIKYSLTGTRVYVDFDINYTEKNVLISIKNTSKNQLNISSDMLTERFIRGDLSRNSEGSGLGLSIAKSLINATNGDFDILIDGDLFKVIVTLKI